MTNLWDYDKPIHEYDEAGIIDIPEWIDRDISPSDVAAIVQGGCDSGAYMPAVTYHKALATMNEHGDAVIEYLEDTGARDGMTLEGAMSSSWAGLACYFLSAAVEQWAGIVEGELDRLLDAIEEDEEDASG